MSKMNELVIEWMNIDAELEQPMTLDERKDAIKRLKAIHNKIVKLQKTSK